MRRILLFLFLSLALISCAGPIDLPLSERDLDAQLKNPLYAEYYFDDLTEQMIGLALREDPILDNEDIRAVVDRTRTRSLQRAALASKKQAEGTIGRFISDRDAASGEALLVDQMLYLGPTFDAAPGPALSVYLTTLVDPRDAAAFPDETALRLGRIKNQYGAQSFAIPDHATLSGATLRTVVLWDDELKLLYGFAQLTHTAR